MSDEEFQKWFIENLPSMVQLGIMHYNADRAKDIRAILNIVHPEIQRLHSRLDDLDAKINRKSVVKGRILGG